ncbi:FGGY-family carbohydrate kinase [Spirillospora sp. CA-255316]
MRRPPASPGSRSAPAARYGPCVPSRTPTQNAGLFSYALTDSAWVIGAAVSNGAEAVRWASGVFSSRPEPGPERDAELLELAESVAAGSDGLVMLPYLLPERAPLWHPRLRGAYLGLTHRHTRGHFVRAAVEGVALRLADIVADLDRLQPVTTVRITGGAFHSPLWRSVVAAAVGRPTLFASGAEGSALGAAALGLHALGHAPRLDTAPALLDPSHADAQPVPASPADIKEYDDLRRTAASLIEELAR